MIRKTTAEVFTCSDGARLLSREAAEKHEITLELDKLVNWEQSHYLHFGEKVTVDWVIKNRSKIREVLNKYCES